MLEMNPSKRRTWAGKTRSVFRAKARKSRVDGGCLQAPTQGSETLKQYIFILFLSRGYILSRGSRPKSLMEVVSTVLVADTSLRRESLRGGGVVAPSTLQSL